jgi:hypothetical protein
MPKPGVYRSPWQDFPDVVIQTTVHKLRSRPAYDQAKRGVGEAAFEVVQELITPEKIPFAFDTVVPVMQFDRDKPNALPLVYATALAKHFDAYPPGERCIAHFGRCSYAHTGSANVHRKDPGHQSGPNR